MIIIGSLNNKIRNYLKSLIEIHKTEKINELDYQIRMINDLIVITRCNSNNEYNLYTNFISLIILYKDFL